MGLSVESQMPMEIIMNPILADEPPILEGKMESIFVKSDQMKNVESMNIDESEIMETINRQQISQQQQQQQAPPQQSNNNNEESKIVSADA